MKQNKGSQQQNNLSFKSYFLKFFLKHKNKYT